MRHKLLHSLKYAFTKRRIANTLTLLFSFGSIILFATYLLLPLPVPVVHKTFQRLALAADCSTLCNCPLEPPDAACGAVYGSCQKTGCPKRECTKTCPIPTPLPNYGLNGTVFIDTNGDGIQDNGEKGDPGVTVNWVEAQTTSSTGTYSFLAHTHYTATLSVTVPAGWTNTTPTSVFTDAPNTVNFGLMPTYTITGNVFVDTNSNGTQDSGENNYPATPTITSSAGSVTQNADGSYSISNLNAGTVVTVSYTSLPANYYMTSPLNGPPPSFQVTVGATGCTVNTAPGALCTAGNISNLNFGIDNTHPWWQATCSDVEEDGIIDLLPVGAVALQSNANCSNTPGLVFTGDTDANFGQGQASSSDQVVGGNSYPEVSSSTLLTSYSSLLAKAQNASITPVDLSTLCTLSNCTLPANLAHGIYIANGDVNLNAYTFPANQNYIFLINGNLTINGSISIPVGSTALFSTVGNISVAPTVGSAPAVTTSTLDGWYVAGQSFIVNSQGNCTDLRLNIAGSVVVNALGNGGTFQNNRDLCANDVLDPSVSFAQRLDFILNAPQFLKQQQTISQELAP